MKHMHNMYADALPVESTARPEGLSIIHRDGCAAAIWERAPAPAFQTWIDGLDPDALPQARVVLRPHGVRSAVSALCADLPEDPGGMKDVLADDIAALAKIFAGVASTDYLRLRLQAVRDDSCRRFHIDRLSLRLICTYRGPGTQYGLATVRQVPDHISTARTGSAMILRGTSYPGGKSAGLLHRSPPVSGTGETRFVLVLDALTGPQ